MDSYETLKDVTKSVNIWAIYKLVDPPNETGLQGEGSLGGVPQKNRYSSNTLSTI